MTVAIPCKGRAFCRRMDRLARLSAETGACASLPVRFMIPGSQHHALDLMIMWITSRGTVDFPSADPIPKG